MIARLLYKFAMTRPLRVISDNGSPYLERYFLFQFLGWRCYLHRFVASDPDRGWHDHPWRLAVSLLLVGWYYESRTFETRKIRWLNILTADSFHRVVLKDVCPDAPREVWTLFFHTQEDVKLWGFMRGSKRSAQLAWWPYSYSGKKKNFHWETVAPKGRDVKRGPNNIALADQDMYVS